MDRRDEAGPGGGGKGEMETPVKAGDGGDGENAPQAGGARRYVLGSLAILLLVATGSGDRVAFKLMADALPSYVYFLHQLTMMVYIVAFFLPVILTGKLKDITWSLARKFCLMGAIDCLCTMSVIMAAPHVFGPMQILLMQGVIPATLVATRIAFGRRFKFMHYLGAFVIVAGIAVSVISDRLERVDTVGNTVLWALLFFFFNIPAAIGSVYKEYTFVNAVKEIDINVMNAWVSFFQFFFGLALFPVAAPLEGISVGELPINFVHGAQCLFGHQTFSAYEPDTCTGYGTLTTFLTLGFNIGWNFFILLIIKYASANLMFLANTLTIPIANLAFAVPWVVAGGPTAKADIHWGDIVALISVVLGLVIYNLVGDPEDPPPKDGGGVGDDDDGGEKDPLLGGGPIRPVVSVDNIGGHATPISINDTAGVYPVIAGSMNDDVIAGSGSYSRKIISRSTPVRYVASADDGDRYDGILADNPFKLNP